MFLMDIQGDPKGLSVGGLVVINKSMSLTVKSSLHQILGNIYAKWHWALALLTFVYIVMVLNAKELCCKLAETVYFYLNFCIS